ncbi:taurine ABC transporter substrate-binding protein [Corynebacterium heidelbergense]|uniref:Glycine/betaine ABC transporter substrate-binding protein n=1 Tax=Corynebacterium heidelbergense TaxID=2055947 RepID=A0A364V5Y7_9CORY|nr:ABC transporter substrate-binding protein [Corynebacterium heidelbergense]RAV32055.1 glycine/betaine ABC transporter substrate-binding protein [Corynebacterium heidelbergense]
MNKHHNATSPTDSPRRHRSLWRTAAAVGAAGLSLSLAACVGPPASHWAKQAQQECPWQPDSSIRTTATIAYQGIPNGDLIVKDRRILETCMPNAKVEWKRFDAGADVLQGFGSGSLDLGLLGSSLVARGASEPLKLDLVVPWAFDVIGDAEALVVKDTNAKQITDLRGKTIAVSFGSTSHFSLLNALKGAGMDANRDVKLINLAPDKMLSGWQSNQIDAAWVWDPTLSQLAKDGHIITSSKATAEAGAPTYDMAAGTRQFVEGNTQFMEQWARAQNYAAEEIAKDPKAAAASIAVELGASGADVEKQLRGYEYPTAAKQASPAILGGKAGETLTSTADFLKQNNLIDAPAGEATFRRVLAPQPAAAASAPAANQK